jgi:hypothetical protein
MCSTDDLCIRDYNEAATTHTEIKFVISSGPLTQSQHSAASDPSLLHETGQSRMHDHFGLEVAIAQYDIVSRTLLREMRPVHLLLAGSDCCKRVGIKQKSVKRHHL